VRESVHIYDARRLARAVSAAHRRVGIENIDLVNYDKDRRPFHHRLSMVPVFSAMDSEEPEYLEAFSEGARSLVPKARPNFNPLCPW
jgi:hypothetical protein